MSVGRLVRHFESLGQAPIEIEDVVKWVKRSCPDEHLSVVPVDIDPRVLRGGYYQYFRRARPDSAMMPERYSLVVYSSRMSVDWQRLVCCKEIIHVMDSDPFKTTKGEEVVALAESFVGNTPPNPKKNLQHFFDELAKYQALATLFPYGLYETLYPAFISGGLDIPKLARSVDLPEKYVRLVMSDLWPEVRKGVLVGFT